jgi:uncharacterized protein DUF5681
LTKFSGGARTVHLQIGESDVARQNIASGMNLNREEVMATKRDSDYQVGYGKPPRHSRFKKGSSGNPKGRPRDSKNAATLLNEALSEQVVISENGRRRTITKKEAIVTQIVNKAASGVHRAIQLLLVNQIPLIEARLEPSQSATPDAPPPPALSAEVKRARALEIARILKHIGYLDQVLGATSETSSESSSKSEKTKSDKS